MKLVLIEISGLLALLIAPLFVSVKPKKKAIIGTQRPIVELSEYAVNEDGLLEQLQQPETLRRAG